MDDETWKARKLSELDRLQALWEGRDLSKEAALYVELEALGEPGSSETARQLEAEGFFDRAWRDECQRRDEIARLTKLALALEAERDHSALLN